MATGTNNWLPIDDLEPEIVNALSHESRLVLQAPTGSGKSTRLPQILWRHGMLTGGQVVVLQPRRLAARLLGAFVARELGVQLGAEVGYQIRFENVTSATTRIRFVTEGVLLRQMITDPKLSGVQVLVFDEFHERHLYGDITLAQALDLQEQHRPDLKLVVMSATLDVAGLEEYLHPCRVLRSEGRTYPVQIEYLASRLGPKSPPVWQLAAGAFENDTAAGGTGDVLIFMPGSYEIQQTLAALRDCGEARGCLLLPLHGELSPHDQDAAVARYDRRKIVVSTNVAETSVTIDGVRLVIDSGLARIPRYDANRGINTLLIEKISQASADQRAGRAGRTAPGHCLRLWSQREHEERAPQELPEVRRLELSEVVLMLKAAGIRDLRAFRWLEPPAIDSLAAAELLLTDLGALDRAGHITPLGRQMLAFPLHPRYARMLLAAAEHRCVRHAALVAALTQGRDLFIRNPGREIIQSRSDTLGDRADSDFWVLTRAWNFAVKQGFRVEACRRLGIHAQSARQVGPLFQQFLDIARREGLDVETHDVPDTALQRCILAGFSDRLARRLDQGTLRCELVHGRHGQLTRESVVQNAPWLVAAEVREVQGSDRSLTTLLSLATAVDISWLHEMFPGEVETRFDVRFDSASRRVLAEERQLFRDLELASRRVDPPPTAEAARLLAAEVSAGRLTLPHWSHGVEQWILRLNLLAKWCPEFELPPIGDPERQHLLEQICFGAFSARDLKDREVARVVHSWVSPDQRTLIDQAMPERVPLSNGRTPKVVYDLERPPRIALRIQELYGVESAPKIAQGRVPVVVEILAPNMRPVQVTQDLASFWREQYPRVKQELQRKYPKHTWQ
jgi:ATP-dependent helicase HrpB